MVAYLSISLPLYSMYLLGTYSNMTNLKSADNCTECPGGSYCETDGLTEPTGLCYAGKFLSMFYFTITIWGWLFKVPLA